MSGAPNKSKYVNAARWYAHIEALLGASFPGAGAGVTIEGSGAGGAATRDIPAAAPAEEEDLGKDIMEEDDDEDLDLFGEMTEEEKKQQEEHKKVVEKKKAKAAEKAKLSKSIIILDVKPWDDETAKLVPIGYGIKKLQITAVIEDAKVPSMDIIIEDDMVQDGENDYIQSVDIVSFNKL